MKSLRYKCLTKSTGYSLVEMMMTLAIGLILASIALPAVVSAIQSYRLNSVAQQVANLIELTRYTAIRRNSLMSVKTAVQNGNTIFYIDLKGNGIVDPLDPLVVLPADMQIVNKQPLTPDPASTRLGPTQDFTTQMWFDYRGTVNFFGGAPVATYFLALGYANQAQYGCRAITVTQMGQTKVWKAPGNGTWIGM